jgi:ribosomal-protein-alanine N-acetyltransferase
VNIKLKISGKKLFLLPVSYDYLKDFHEYSTNKKFYKYFEYGPFIKLSESKKYIRKMIKLSKKNSQFYFIILKKIDKCIGTICIKNIDMRSKSGELGYGLNPNYWGQGFFSISLRLLEKFLCKKIKLKTLFAVTSSNNFRSIMALKKLGYKIEGKLKNFYQAKYCDAYILTKMIS